MDPIFGPIIGAGISGLASMFGTQQNNQNQQALLQQQEQYNTQMSNTAYQRASADMKAAGLNPMMMFGSGSAASSPTAPAAQPKQSALSSVGPAVQQAFSSAVQAQTVNKASEEIANMKVENAKLRADVDLSRAHATQATTGARLQTAETQRLERRAPIDVSEAEKAKLVQDVYTNPVTRKIVQGGVVGSSARDALSPIADIAGGITSSALRKRGLDIMSERLRSNY